MVSILLYLGMAGGLVLLTNVVGLLLGGDFSIEAIFKRLHFGYSLLFRLMLPAMYITACALVLYELNRAEYVAGIWLVTLFYVSSIIIVGSMLGRARMVNFSEYAIVSLLAVCFSFAVTALLLVDGANAIVPERAFFVHSFWALGLGVFVYMAFAYRPNASSYVQIVDNLVVRLAKAYRKKYIASFPKKSREDEMFCTMFLAVLVTEDINRPRGIRFIENLVFPLGIAKTTGIMQMTSDKLLTDQASVDLAHDYIMGMYKTCQKKKLNEYETIEYIAKQYNGEGYANIVIPHYFRIKYLSKAPSRQQK